MSPPLRHNNRYLATLALAVIALLLSPTACRAGWWPTVRAKSPTAFMKNEAGVSGILGLVLHQISPYLLPVFYDYDGAGGKQEQLTGAASLLLSDPAVRPILAGNADLESVSALLRSPAIGVLLDGVNVGELVLGTGFKGMLSTLIDSEIAPPALQPLLEQIGPYIPYIISNYYSCGGETNAFFDAINSVLTNPLVEVSESRYHPVAKKKKLTRAPILLRHKKALPE